MRRTSLTALVSATTLAFFGLAISPVAAVVPTILNVNTASDLNDAPCTSASTTTPNPLSLRDAVCLANNLPIGTPVQINVPANTYTLNAAYGELDLGTTAGENVTVIGQGAATTIIDAGWHSRVFNIDMNSLGGVKASLQNLTVTNGSDSTFGGAGILAGSAGAVPADSLSLSGVTVSYSRAGGANATTQAATNLPGGGLQFMGGALNITNSRFDTNTTQSSAGSAIAYQAFGAGTESFTLSNSTIIGNSEANRATAADIEDGAVQLSSPTNATTGPTGIPMTISNTLFSGNSISGVNGPGRGAALALESGGLNVTGSNFVGNTVSGANSKGGAIAVVDGVATMQRNRIVGNTAPAGNGAGLALVGAASLNASDNWWGCNAGPGNTGCDSTFGSPTTNPRLVLSGAPVSLLVSATATVSADITHDSSGNAVAGSEPALDGVDAQLVNPTPAGASCDQGGTSFGGGTATVSCTFHPNGNDGAGGVSITVDHQTITVPVTVNAPPSVTTNPSDTTVLAGSNASFTAAANGYPAPTVQWQVSTDGGATFNNISGATSTTYSLSGVTIGQDHNQYRAVFTNTAGSATTNAATLTVHVPPSFTSGTTANFTVGAAGSFMVSTSGLPPNATISTTSTLPSGLSLVNNGDGTATLSGTPASGTGGSYTVNLTATNGVSPDGTQALTVVVSEAPAVTTNPSDVTTTPGTTASFTAAASGYPSPTVQWQRSTDGGVSFTNIPSATNTTYQVTATIALDGTQYRAVFSNGVGSPATTTAATLTVHQAPAITSAGNTTFTQGSPGTFTVTTTGYPTPTLTQTGALPSGVTFVDNHDGTATLSGTPAPGTSGVYNLGLKASNGVNPDATSDFTLTVTLSPMITSANATTFTTGSAGTFTVTTTGLPAPGLTKTGTLPSGVTFTDNHDGTGTLAGTPAPGSGGVYNFSFSADNGVGTAAGQDFTLTVDEAPSITSADHATFTAGTTGTFTVTTTGFPSASLNHTGSLPSGVTLVDNNDGTATLAGTPAAGTGGTYQFAIEAGNGIGSGAAQTFTLTVDESASITSANSTTFTAGASGTFSVTTSGFPAPSLSETGSLPTGVSFTENGNGTGTLSGTPAAGTGGTYTLTFTAHNGIGTDDGQDFTLHVNEAPAISSAASTTFTVGTAGTFSVTSTGTPTASLTETGALPGGVTFTDNHNGTATLAGTPTAGTGGTYHFTLTAGNGVSPDATQDFTLTVDEAASITSANTVSFGAAVAASPFTVTTSGFPTPSLSETGSLPSGITFTDNHDGTATLAGTPASGTAGSYPIAITGHNGIGTDATQDFTLVVTVAPQAITFTSTPPAGAVVGQTYVVAATGGGSGNAVSFTIDPSAASVCSVSGSTVTLNHPGNCVVDAHQNGNGQYAAADNQQSLAVGKASTNTAIAVAAHTITATVTAVSPGAGTPGGTVTFSVNGSGVGTASLNGSGVATLTYSVPNGQSQNVAAVYAGDSDYSASSASTARQDPAITASVSSSAPRTGYGWYRRPVTVTFTCTPTSAPLTAPCPSPVTLSGNGAGQSVTRTVMATDGGAATVAVNGINIDMRPPSVAISGVTNGATYSGVAPKAKCVATDALSGVASCTLKSANRSGVVTVTATARDKAGNVATAHRTYRVLQIFILGKTPKNGAYNLPQGQWFTVVALTSTKITPRYYDAVPFGQTPRPADNFFKLAGHQGGMYRYTVGVYLGTGMSRYKYWAFGVKIGRTMYQVKFHPLP